MIRILYGTINQITFPCLTTRLCCEPVILVLSTMHNISIFSVFVFSFSFSIVLIFGQNSCQCMEYWKCTNRNGTPYSYCGISESEICCFFDNNEPPAPATVDNRPRPSTLTSTIPNRRPIASASTSTLTQFGNSTCGTSRVQPILDNISQFREWPYHIAILEVTDDLYICGGSLISQDRILTAAHCVQNYVARNSPRLKIRAGEYDVSSNSEPTPHVEVLISMIAVHPNFNNETLVNDIAILGINRKIRFQDNINSICIPPQGNRDIGLRDGRCVVTGWGRPREMEEHSKVLKEIVIPLWESDICERSLRRHFGPDFRLSTNALCAGDENRDACDGDGGSPLACLENGRWVQIGIVSYGVGCGRQFSPGVYTRVSSFTNFINQFL